MFRSLTAAFAAVLSLLVPAGAARAATAPMPASPQEAPAAPRPTAFAARSRGRASVGRRLRVLINARRRRQGLGPLRWNRRLALAARRHSIDMVHRRYFDHTTPDGWRFDRRIWAAGYGRSASWTCGETIAWSPR